MARRGKLNKVESVEIIERPARSRKYTYYILIVCEDEKTEPEYFRRYQYLFSKILPKETIYLRSVGSGRSSLGVVKYANEQKAILRQESGKDVDQIWVVFDKDDLDKTKGNRKNFEEAFNEANDSNIKIAYSNECFELWLLLHFEAVDASKALHRDEIYQRLEDAIRRKVDPLFNYVHGDSGIINLIWEKGNKKSAIARAKTLDSYHMDKGISPIDSNPNTLVYMLVQELDKWYAYYAYEE